MIIINVQISVQNNFGNYSGSNDWIGQDVVELSGDLHWIHNVHLSSIIIMQVITLLHCSDQIELTECYYSTLKDHYTGNSMYLPHQQFC